MAERAATLAVPAKPPLKRKSQYAIVGRPLSRFDIPAKVDGTTVYGADPGGVVNAATFSAQLRGGAIFGLSATLYGAITIAKGRVVEQTFSDYEMVRIAETPAMEMGIIESGASMGAPASRGHRPLPPPSPRQFSP
jgi:hypothetical protein